MYESLLKVEDFTEKLLHKEIKSHDVVLSDQLLINVLWTVCRCCWSFTKGILLLSKRFILDKNGNQELCFRKQMNNVNNLLAGLTVVQHTVSRLEIMPPDLCHTVHSRLGACV